MEQKDPMLKQVRAKMDDKDHAILYKSPGPYRGDKGRPIDHKHVKTKEEAAEAIAAGWSVSEEEAHELAEALAEGKRGKKLLVRKRDADEEPEEEETEEDAEEAEEEDPILKAPAKKPKKKAKK